MTAVLTKYSSATSVPFANRNEPAATRKGLRSSMAGTRVPPSQVSGPSEGSTDRWRGPTADGPGRGRGERRCLRADTTCHLQEGQERTWTPECKADLRGDHIKNFLGGVKARPLLINKTAQREQARGRVGARTPLPKVGSITPSKDAIAVADPEKQTSPAGTGLTPGCHSTTSVPDRPRRASAPPHRRSRTPGLRRHSRIRIRNRSHIRSRTRSPRADDRGGSH